MNMKRVLVLFIITGFCAALAVGGLLLGLSTSFGLNALRRTVETQGSRFINGRIAIGRIEGNLWRQVTLYDFSITLPDSLGGDEAVGADRITVSLDFWRAFVWKSVLSTVAIDGLRVAYIERDEHRPADTITTLLNPGGVPDSPETNAPPRIPIPELYVTRGRLHYFDPADSTTVRLSNIFLRGSMTDTEHLTAGIGMSKASFFFHGYRDSVSSIFTNVRLAGDTLAIRDMALEAAAAPPLAFHINGFVAPSSPFPASLAITGNGDAGAIARVIGVTTTLKGRFEVTASLHNTLKDPVVEARFASPNLITDVGRFREAAVHLRYDADVLTFERYAGLMEAGRVSGQGMLDLSRPRKRYRLTLAADSLTLADLPGRLVGAAFPFSGRTALTAEVSGTGFDADAALTGTAGVDVRALHVANVPIGALSARVHYDRGRIHLSVRTPTATAEAEGALPLTGEADITAAVTIPDGAAFAALFGKSRVTGAAELNATLHGDVTRPDIRLDGRVRHLGYADIPLGDLEMTGSLDTGMTARIDAAIDTDKIVFSAEVDLENEAQPLDGTMRVHALQLHDYLAAYDRGWGFEGVIDVEGTLSGSVRHPEFRGKGLLRAPSIRGEQLGDTSLSVTVNKEDAAFTIVSADFSVFSDGIISFSENNPYDVRLDLKRANLTPLLAILSKRPIERQTGRFTGRMQATGFVAYPDLSTITMALDSLIVSVGDRALYFAAPSTIRLDRQVATIDRLELSGDFGHVLVNGIASLAKDGLLELEALFENVQLDFLSPFLLSRGRLGGLVNAQLSLTGALDAPVFNGSFATEDVLYRLGKRVNHLGSVTAEFLYKDRLFQIPYLALDTPIGTSYATVFYPMDLSWSGEKRTPPDEPFHASLTLDHLALGPLREFLPSIPVDLEGRINGRISLAGSAAHPEDVTGTVLVDSLRIASIQYEVVNKDSLRLHFHDGIVDIDTIRVALHQLDERATPRGAIKGGGRIVLGTHEGDAAISDFSLIGQDIAVESLLSLFGKDLPLAGRLSGDVLLVGPPSSQSMEGSLSLGHILYNRATLDSMAGHFLYHDGELKIYEFQTRTGEDTLYASGTIPFNPAGAGSDSGRVRDMALTVQGHDIDLRFLTGLTYNLERIGGKADVDLNIGGPPSAPRSVGEITIYDPLIQFRDVRPSLRASRMRFAVDGNQIVLQPVELKAGGGSVNLYTRLVVQNFGLTDYEMHATLDRADIELIGSAKLRLDGKLSVEGDAAQSRMTGQGLTVRGAVTHPMTLGGIILGGGGIIRPPSAPDPFFERMAMNVEIDIPELRIRNRLVNLDLQGGLACAGTAQNPVITGNAIVNDGGTILYFDTQFDVRDSRLEFVKRTPLESFSALIDDPVQQLDPELAIQGSALRVRDIYGDEYDVSLSITGRATQPNLQLTAVPVDESTIELRGSTLIGPEVVSLLTFGLPGLSRNALGGTNPFSGIGQRALLMATGNQAERLLRLDEVRIEGDVLNRKNAGTPAQITISKRINRRTQVTYTSLIDSADFKIRIGYQLSRLLFIETHSDQISERPQTGVDLKVKFRFR